MVNYCISQNTSEIDSLKILLEKSSAIDKAKLLREIGDSYLEVGFYQKAIPYYKESLEISVKQKDEIPYAYALQRIGKVYSGCTTNFRFYEKLTSSC